MPELIDKAKVLKYLTPRIKAETPYGEGYNRALEDAAELVTLMPTIEPEVPHGRWNYRHEDDWCYCTVCGTDAEGSDGECLETDYCPHCGAPMDGGDDNDSE